MPMTIAIPSNFEAFVQHEVASGAAGNEQELVSRALELYRRMRQRQAALRADVQHSLADVERGEVAELDVEAIIARRTARLAAERITG